MYYDCLLIDADDTIFDFRQAERSALDQLLSSRGLPSTPELHDLYSMTNMKLWRQLERGERTRDEILVQRFRTLIDYIRREADWHPEWQLDEHDWEADEPELLNEQFLDRLSEQATLLPDVEPVLRELALSTRLALVTNGVTRVQEGRLRRSGLAPLFEGIFISERLGIDKPDPGFFDRVLDELGLEDRSRALVVGDGLGSDIQGAMLAGLDSCWVNHRQQTLPADGPRPTYTISNWRDLPLLLSTV